MTENINCINDERIKYIWIDGHKYQITDEHREQMKQGKPVIIKETKDTK